MAWGGPREADRAPTRARAQLAARLLECAHLLALLLLRLRRRWPARGRCSSSGRAYRRLYTFERPIKSPHGLTRGGRVGTEGGMRWVRGLEGMGGECACGAADETRISFCCSMRFSSCSVCIEICSWCSTSAWAHVNEHKVRRRPRGACCEEGRHGLLINLDGGPVGNVLGARGEVQRVHRLVEVRRRRREAREHQRPAYAENDRVRAAALEQSACASRGHGVGRAAHHRRRANPSVTSSASSRGKGCTPCASEGRRAQR